MRRSSTLLFILACFAALFLACYARALSPDRQFGYRDVVHYYYPLHRCVQAEWEAGRWPLWEMGENSGMPLLGNPTAAVLYPGKVIFALLPYAWAARVYIVAHTALAFAAMVILLRSWQTSWVGSAIGGLAYAFGAPILFQHCNVIYLVGAAWLPLGFHAVDRWVRLGRRWGLLELAAVLTMQTLGGDPQASYLLGLAAGGYAVGLAWRGRDRTRPEDGDGSDAPPRRTRFRWAIPIALIGLAAWFEMTLMAARWLPRLRPRGLPVPPLPWMDWVPLGVGVTWVGVAAGSLVYWWKRRRRSPLGTAWLGLASAAVLATGLSAAQLLPVYEFTQQTARAASPDPHDIYPFSIQPLRLIELVWPNIFGTRFRGNAYWLDMLPVPAIRTKIWVPSLYLGGLTLVLASGGLAFRGGDPRRVWLSVVMAVGLLGSLGPYTSPILAARVVAEASGWPMARAWRRTSARSIRSTSPRSGSTAT